MGGRKKAEVVGGMRAGKSCSARSNSSKMRYSLYARSSLNACSRGKVEAEEGFSCTSLQSDGGARWSSIWGPRAVDVRGRARLFEMEDLRVVPARRMWRIYGTVCGGKKARRAAFYFTRVGREQQSGGRAAGGIWCCLAAREDSDSTEGEVRPVAPDHCKGRGANAAWQSRW